MNEWEIQKAQTRHAHHPIKRRAAKILQSLMDLTNSCSDGWPYWAIPRRSAAKLMTLIEDTADPTENDLKTALRPIKAMLTRHRKSFGGRTIDFE